MSKEKQLEDRLIQMAPEMFELCNDLLRAIDKDLRGCSEVFRISKINVNYQFVYRLKTIIAKADAEAKTKGGAK